MDPKTQARSNLEQAISEHFAACYGADYYVTGYALVVKGLRFNASDEPDCHYLYVRPKNQDPDVTENILRRWLRVLTHH